MANYYPEEIVSTLEGYYRKYIGKTSDGFNVFQDFYEESHQKLTDPFIIKSLDEVGWPYDIRWNERIIYNGVYALYDESGSKKVEHHFYNGEMTKVVIIDELLLTPDLDFIFLDAESLAEGNIVELYENDIAPHLREIIGQPAHLQSFDAEHTIIANECTYSFDDAKHSLTWEYATFIFFDIVNQQLLNSKYKFYAFCCCNSLSGMFLTDKGYQHFLQTSNQPLGKPYLPTKELDWSNYK